MYMFIPVCPGCGNLRGNFSEVFDSDEFLKRIPIFEYIAEKDYRL